MDRIYLCHLLDVRPDQRYDLADSLFCSCRGSEHHRRHPRFLDREHPQPDSVQ